MVLLFMKLFYIAVHQLFYMPFLASNHFQTRLFLLYSYVSLKWKSVHLLKDILGSQSDEVLVTFQRYSLKGNKTTCDKECLTVTTRLLITCTNTNQGRWMMKLQESLHFRSKTSCADRAVVPYENTENLQKT